MHQDRVGVGLKTVRHTHTHLYTSCKVFNSTNSFCIQRTGSSAIESLGIRHRLWHSVGSKAPIAPGVVCLERANTKLPFGTLNTANLCTDTKILFFSLSFSCVCLPQDAWRPAAHRWLLHEHVVPDPYAVPVLLLQPPFCSGCTHWPQVSPGKVD